MSFLQLRYFSRDIELSNSERRTIYRGVRKLWWSRRRNFVIYVFSCAVGLTVVNLRIVFFKGGQPHSGEAVARCLPWDSSSYTPPRCSWHLSDTATLPLCDGSWGGAAMTCASSAVTG
jgi:hypothetical protein